MMEAFRPASAAARLRHVFLRNMVLPASIGVHAHEHAARQRLRINLDLAVAEPDPAQSRAAARRDELGGVVDYEAVANRIRAIVAAGHVRLLETLAERMAEACLADSRVRVVRVRLEKLDIFTDMEAAGIEIERRAEDSPTDSIPRPP